MQDFFFSKMNIRKYKTIIFYWHRTADKRTFSLAQWRYFC